MTELDVRWRAIEALRRDADRALGVIAQAAGPDSTLHQRCREVWRQREADASTSILFADLRNAEVILDRGVHSLRHALEASTRERIPVEELVALMAAC